MEPGWLRGKAFGCKSVGRAFQSKLEHLKSSASIMTYKHLFVRSAIASVHCRVQPQYLAVYSSPSA